MSYGELVNVSCHASFPLYGMYTIIDFMNMSNGDVLKTYNIQMIMYMIILYVIYSRPLGILKVVLYGLFCVLPVGNIYIYEYNLPYAMVRKTASSCP